MSTAQRVIDEIGVLVDEQLRQEASGYDHNLNQPRCRCGAEWHGIATQGCPGSNVEGPLAPPSGLIFDETRWQPLGSGELFGPIDNLVAAMEYANAQRRRRDAYDVDPEFRRAILGAPPDQRLYRSATENIRMEYQRDPIEQDLSRTREVWIPERGVQYTITCLDCRQSGRLIRTDGAWYTFIQGPPPVVECAFRDGPPCEHWELVGA